MSLLHVEGLCIDYADAVTGWRRVVDGLSLQLAPGEALGLVGESGSGKSQTAQAILRLQGPQARLRGRIDFAGEALLTLPEAAMNRLRGARIAYVFQDPMTALNPYRTIGAQMAEVLQRHRGATRAAAWAECARMLDALRVSAAAARLRAYPHEFSGGMRQRVLIAMALLLRPQLLIADEPTTALDVTVQAQLLRVLAELRREFGMALLLISHDLGVVAEVCERIAVLYAGRMVEQGPTAAILAQARHPYTQALLRARPDPRHPEKALQALPGQVPRWPQLISGCVFSSRCDKALPRCCERAPDLPPFARGSACWRSDELDAV